MRRKCASRYRGQDIDWPTLSALDWDWETCLSNGQVLQSWNSASTFFFRCNSRFWMELELLHSVESKTYRHTHPCMLYLQLQRSYSSQHCIGVLSCCRFHNKPANTDITMDPLSIGASILAILGAAATAGRTLEKLCSLRHAPDDLIALINEASLHTPHRTFLWNTQDQKKSDSHGRSQICKWC